MAGYDGTQLHGALGGLFKGEAIHRSMMQDLANLEQTRASTDQLRQKMDFDKELQPLLKTGKELENKTTALGHTTTEIGHDTARLGQITTKQAQEKEDMLQFGERQKTLSIELSEMPPGLQWDYAKEALGDNPKSKHFYDSLQAAQMNNMIPKNKDGSTPTLSQILARMSDATISQSLAMRKLELEAKNAGVIEGMKTERALAVEGLQGKNQMAVAQYKGAIDKQIAAARLAAQKSGTDTAKTFQQNANKYFDLAMQERDPDKRAMLLQAANQFKEAAISVGPVSDPQQAVLGEDGIEYVNRRPPSSSFMMPGAQAPGQMPQPAAATMNTAPQAAGAKPAGSKQGAGKRYEPKSKAEAQSMMKAAQSGDVIIYNGKAFTKP